MKFVYTNVRRGLIPFSLLILTACGGGSGTSTETALNQQPQSGEVNYIAGAGIKGPLAYASVELYSLDNRFDDLYDKTAPLAVATTNAYAEITGLAVPSNTRPPYVLVVDGTNAIDRNTEQAPVIHKLVTIITQSALNSGRSVYATPYTTVAYHMLRSSQTRGRGLSATYYSGVDFDKPVLTRNDPKIDFNWSKGAPAASVPADNFSVRWAGQVKPRYSEDYTFYTNTDDGVRLWVDGKLLIDRWVDQPAKEYSAKVRLEGGKEYPIVMEYYDATQHAVAKLQWSSASQNKAVIRNRFLSTDDGSYSNLDARMAKYNKVIVKALGFGIPDSVDIFSTPPIISQSTTEASQQQLVVDYRAAIEALSGMVNRMSENGNGGLSTDQLLERLAIDLRNDAKVDNRDGARTLNAIDVSALTDNPMTVWIPNSRYQVKDIVALIDDERTLVGNAGNVYFLKNNVTVGLEPAGLGRVAETPVQGRVAEKPVQGGVVETPVQVSYPDAVGKKTNALLLSGLLAAPPVGGEVIFSHDFNNEAPHVYTSQDIKKTWKGKSAISLQPNAVSIVKDPDPSGARGNVMRVFYRANQTTTDGNSGSQWRTKLKGKYEDLYFAYDVYFPDNADFVLGGKLPGLMGGPVIYAGGKPANGNDGWTGRLMWHKNGSVQSYMYVANNPSLYGWNFDWDLGSEGQRYLKRGQWNRLEMRYVMNTPGVPNGRMQAWFNGKLALDAKGLIYRMPAGKNVAIDQLLFSTFYGGKADKWAPSTDQYVYFDNFVVSTKPITH